MSRAILCTEFGPVQGLRWEEEPDPALGPADVRIEIRAASVGYMDNLMARGLYQLKPDLPYTPGACGAGIVLEVGADVTGLAAGERVSFLNYFGAFAERIVTPQTSVVRMPEDLSFEQAATQRLTFAPAAFALTTRGTLAQGETLVVTGATGGVGAAAIEVGKRLGARVIAAVGTAEKAEHALANGAHDAVVYGDRALRTSIRDLTGGVGADVILDVVGGDVFDEVTHAVAPLGRILTMGFTSDRIPQVRTNLLLLKNASVVGVFFGGWGMMGRNVEGVARLNDQLAAWHAEKPLTVDIRHRMPMERSADALDLVVERSTIGKIVLTNE